MKNQEHFYSVDLIKVIAMFMIVILHMTGVGGANNASLRNLSLNIIFSGMEGISFVCVNLFALTTGFLCIYKTVNYSRLLQLWLQAEFISVVCFITVFIFKGNIGFVNTVKSFFILTFEEYWYLNEYVILMIIAPILNHIIKRMSANEAILTTGLILFLSVFWTMTGTARILKGYSFVWLISLYFLGAFIRKYRIYKITNKSIWIIVYIFSTVLEIVLVYLSRKYDMMLLGVKSYNDVYSWYNNIFILLSSVSLFSLLLNVVIKKEIIKKIIAGLALTSFSVYLFHTSASIWPYILNNCGIFGTMTTIKGTFLLLAVALLIYLIGSLLGFIQIMFFKLIKADIICNKIEKKIRQIIEYGCDRIKLKLKKCVDEE